MVHRELLIGNGKDGVTQTAARTVSVVIPTHNRPEKLRETVKSLRSQQVPGAALEIVVVDDGSFPPIRIEDAGVKLVRLEGVERSAARNAGAAASRGDILLFVDDDMTARSDFIEQHLAAHDAWPGSLVVGRITIDPQTTQTPFGRFRQSIETSGIPLRLGPVSLPNFCAANASIARERFEELGGFDPQLNSAEDQDLALRHTSTGGRIVYVPEAEVIHHDDAVSVQSYCRRTEWGYDNIVPFVQRHPAFVDNIERVRVNGPVRFGGEPLRATLGKIAKSLLALPPFQAALFASAAVLERSAPNSAALRRLYSILLGIHLRRGFLRGLRRWGGEVPVRS